VSKKELKGLIKDINILNSLKYLKLQIGDHDMEDTNHVALKFHNLTKLESLKIHFGRNINLKNN